MRFNFSIITVLLAAALLTGSGGSAHAQKSKGQGRGQGQGIGRGEGKGQGEDKKQQTQSEAVIAATATVNITLSTGSGKISVRGWDKQEVRARAKDKDATVEANVVGGRDEATPAARVEILVSDKSEEDNACSANSDLLLDVPRGATLNLKTQDGDIEVDDVTEVHIETSGGRVDLRRISKATEAASVGNDITLEDSGGRARLNTLGGVIQVRNIRLLDAGDFLKIKTVSGDILLDRIGPARVEADTISGGIEMAGPLARGGSYTFTTTTGDVTLDLPADSSFKINARVSEGGEIVTDFPLKYKGSTSPASLLHAGRIQATYGSGDSTINLVSFSGTLQLRKK
ncbi:MAG TPA: DUF4097 family beta strand repeat-containing protein [Pyrinomonadaceae bacterium]